MAVADNETLAWLLEGDPSVRWQVERDLLAAPEQRWQRTRARVAREGWGRALLAQRAEDGSWGGSLYHTRWTSTFYTLRLLTQLGLPPDHPAGVASCKLLLDGVTPEGGAAYWQPAKPDTCVTAMLLSMAVWFGQRRDPRCESMVRWLLGEQMDDGGWNCQLRRKGASHASFHTTLSTLEAFAAWRSVGGGPARRVDAAARAARTFFLEHQLYRSHRTGKVVRSEFGRFHFPPHWKFDVLRGLEYFSTVGARVDARLRDPIELVERRRRADGRWDASRHSGKYWLQLEPARGPSRINTLRALRVLRWAGR